MIVQREIHRMTRLRPGFVALLLSVFVLSSLPAFAGPLDDAKAAGLVGETTQGLIASVKNSPSPEIIALIDDINIRRMAEFASIAARTESSVEQVQSLVGERQIASAASGNFVMDAAGNWHQVP